ncbi:hypothetical protein BC943DRAFT_319562 [Umbelopsis sp. AD052]|nr:hypothetical protein BC943DRAFT_319562 [Umbelopsis sp. AD052]
MVRKSLRPLLMLSAVQLAALLLFCKGFFPYKTYLPGFATTADAPEIFSKTADSNEPQFDRLVFVLVDALRNDFVFERGSGFSFVKSLISQGSAKPFTAKATAPTVTLPRIKALTTGAIPSFIDAILNIAESDTSSSLAHQDNWVYQLHKNGSNTINFFGDDTWIKLFPGLFRRTDGTTSFFVSDTVQVDTNVTRHVQSEIAKEDWTANIFHYLGLDHIGHIGGPKSHLMMDKQKEMDNVIRTIYEYVAEDDSQRRKRSKDALGTLIVLCGDHGMNEAGNHGGSSDNETSTAMVFMSPKYESRPIIKHHAPPQPTFSKQDQFGYPQIDQIDLVPTLAMLFGLPIPRNSIGKIILELFIGQNGLRALRALQVNSHQLGDILHAHHGAYYEEPAGDDTRKAKLLLSLENSEELTSIQEAWHALHFANGLHRQYVETKAFSTAKSKDLLSRAESLYMKFIVFSHDQLARTASLYDLPYMYLGMFLSFVSTVFHFRLLASTKSDESDAKQSTLLGENITMHHAYVGISLVMYCVSLFASSFIEEEHLFWFYFIQTSWLIMMFENLRRYGYTDDRFQKVALVGVSQMIVFRILQAWNQTGNQHAGEIDIRYWLSNEYDTWSWHLLAATLILNALQCVRNLWQMQLVTSRIRDISQAARVIYRASKVIFLICICLTSTLVVVYKVRTEKDQADIPSIYRDLATWELPNRLDQQQLGRLIYNYVAAAFFMLNSTIFIGKYVRKLDITNTRNMVAPAPYVLLLLRTVTPLLILLSRTHNAILFAFFDVQLELFYIWFRCEPASVYANSPESHSILTNASIILGMIQSAFFIMGNSNSLSSVDLGNSYIGVDGYDVGTTGLLTFISNWSGSVWWTFAGISLIAHGYWLTQSNSQPPPAIQLNDDVPEPSSQDEIANDMDDNSTSNDEDNTSAIAAKELISYYSSFYIYFAIFFNLALTTLTVSVTILRQHLFIWTVFSPKFLFQGAWVVLYHFMIQTLLATVLIGTWLPWCIT